ncbi:MAG: response regulator [Myxococcaceae bacterium]
MSGARVAVIGGGVSGAAVAAALTHGARARGRAIEVRIYGGSGATFHAPVLLTRECRARLAALGCAVPEGTRPVPGVEVFAGTASESFPAGTGGLWIAPQAAMVRNLATVAARSGARFLGRRVDSIERDDKPEGPLVVRSNGAVERYTQVVLATGAAEGPWSLKGARAPPALPAIEAELALHAFTGPSTVKLFLSPAPGVEGLYLIPAGRAVHALAFGWALGEAELCEALMVASRDGHLPMGFSVAGVRATRVSNGAGSSLVSPGVLAVGPAAMGHPLQLGLAATLASCSRVAGALLDSGSNPIELERLLLGGVEELVESARFGARAFSWLLKARGRAPLAIARARRGDGPGCWGGVLGLPAPTTRSLLRWSRLYGIAEVTRSIFFVTEEVAPAHPKAEPRLVYVVDDDDDVREALTHFLRSKGAEVISFSDELSLFAAVAVRRPAAILLDVVLRRVDGLRLCEGLRRHPDSRGIRVLVTSGLSRPHIKARALAAGAAAFLPKPLDPALLWAALCA